VSRLLTIWFGVGLLRPAPGTWGSAVAIIMALGLHAVGGFVLLALAAVAVTVVGFWACRQELVGRVGEDPSEIVIDEVAGQWLAFAIPASAFWARGVDVPAVLPWPAWVGAFLLFRLFDIWKPWLVGRADARHDAAGVMLDDLWAGLFAGIGVIILGVIYHVVLFA
jgi:phosphatidylglycerophosphatase A